MPTSPFLPHARYDAVVVGARVAGAATAMLLGRAGMRVLLVDRQAYGTDTLSTHALMRGAVLLLSRWGLLSAVVASGAPAITETTFRYGDEAVTVPIKPDGEVDALYAPRRTVLDPILADAAWNAGVEVRHDTIVVDVIVEDGRARGVILKDADGNAHRVTSDLVIGADGVGSTVARRVRAPVLVQGEVSTATLFGYVPNPEAAGYQWLYGLKSSVGVIPTNDALACLFVSVPTARFDREIREDLGAGFVRVLEEVDPNHARHAAFWSPEIRVFRGRPGFLRSAHGPGWALVGDAGFFRDPLTAHGITDALRDADALARAVVAGNERAMVDFAEERDRTARAFLEATDDIACYDWPLEELKERHRRLSGLMKAEVAAIAARPVPPEPAARQRAVA